MADALAAVLAGAKPLGEESVDLWNAHHRTLSRDVVSLRTQPPADMSAMDGYAVRFDDATRTAAESDRRSRGGHAVRQNTQGGRSGSHFTGGVVPPGADHIVIQENTTRDGDTVIVNADAAMPRHIRAAGVDFREGDVLLRKARASPTARCRSPPA